MTPTGNSYGLTPSDPLMAARRYARAILSGEGSELVELTRTNLRELEAE